MIYYTLAEIPGKNEHRQIVNIFHQHHRFFLKIRKHIKFNFDGITGIKMEKKLVYFYTFSPRGVRPSCAVFLFHCLFLWQLVVDNYMQCTLAQTQKVEQKQNSGGYPWFMQCSLYKEILAKIVQRLVLYNIIKDIANFE